MALLLALLLIAMQAGSGPSQDPALARGIRQVEEGDLEAALGTLGGAVRSLSQQGGRDPELARAHLYQGIAYALLDQEKAARASFREALRLDSGLELDRGRVPTKAVRLFQASREDILAMWALEKPASLPQASHPEAAGAAPRASAEDNTMGRVWLFRDASLGAEGSVIGKSDVEISVDGRRVVRMERASYALLVLPPGQHVLRAGRRGAASTEIEVRAGEDYYIRFTAYDRERYFFYLVETPDQAARAMLELEPLDSRKVDATDLVVAGARYPPPW